MEHIKISGMTFSSDAGARPAATAHGRTIHERLTPFPVAYFTAALVTDFVYWRTPDTMWERFSVWLIAGGLVMAAFVALAAVVDLVSGRQPPSWLRALGYAFGIVLSVFNVFIHSRDGYTAVVPTGLTLSAIAVIVLLMSSAGGWSLTHRYRIGARK
jgi:uncharacterized membrane protein